MNLSSSSLRGALYGIGAASIWGGLYVVSEYVLKFFSPFLLVAIRLLIGVVTFLILARLARTPVILPRGDMLRLLAVGALGYGLSVGAQFAGTAFAGAINGSVITSASPAFILLFAWLILHEPLTRLRVFAVALASIGVLIVLDLSQFDLGSRAFQGNLILVFAALTWGAYSVLVRRVSARFPTMTVTTWGLVGGLAFCLPLGIIENAGRSLPTLDLPPLLGVLYLGIISTAAASWLWNRSFALVEAGTASLFFFAQPLVGVLLSNILNKQPITPQIIIGGGLIVLGVLLSTRPERAATAEAG